MLDLDEMSLRDESAQIGRVEWRELCREVEAIDLDPAVLPEREVAEPLGDQGECALAGDPTECDEEGLVTGTSDESHLVTVAEIDQRRDRTEASRIRACVRQYGFAGARAPSTADSVTGATLVVPPGSASVAPARSSNSGTSFQASESPDVQRDGAWSGARA